MSDQTGRTDWEGFGQPSREKKGHYHPHGETLFFRMIGLKNPARLVRSFPEEGGRKKERGIS